MWRRRSWFSLRVRRASRVRRRAALLPRSGPGCYPWDPCNNVTRGRFPDPVLRLAIAFGTENTSAVVPLSGWPHAGGRPNICSARPIGKGEGRGAMALSLDAAAEVFREAMRDTVKRYSLWYLIQGVLLIAAGILAIIYPVLSSTAVIVLLGWLLIISGVV